VVEADVVDVDVRELTVQRVRDLDLHVPWHVAEADDA
jgi:hypothetical protein